MLLICFLLVMSNAYQPNKGLMMKFQLKPEKPLDAVAADMLAVGVFSSSSQETFKLTKALGAIDKKLGGFLASTIEREEFKAQPGQTVGLATLGKLKSNYIVLYGLGEPKKLELDSVRQTAAKAFKAANAKKLHSIYFVIPDTHTLFERDVVRASYEGAQLATYQFARYLTQNPPTVTVKEFQLGCAEKSLSQLESAVKDAKAICEGVMVARDLVNEPPALMTPVAIAKQTQQLCKDTDLTVTILDEKELRKERMGLMLAVAQGAMDSAPPRLIRIAYTPKKKAKKHVVLVGKGVMFDTGGLNLKPADGMLDMKTDMAGAATVLGTLLAVAHLKPSVAVTGYLGCVENSIGPHAYHPSDILTSRKGLTVEINNTDAEGRLVLADVLTYTQDKDKPDLVIDLATLTGAAVVALGPYTTAVFSDDEKLCQDIRSYGKAAGEDFWRMPLNEELSDQLKTPAADLKNCGNRWGGCITAALFLKRFVNEDTKWAHLDIAGPASSDKESAYIAKGGTGFAVRTLANLIADM